MKTINKFIEEDEIIVASCSCGDDEHKIVVKRERINSVEQLDYYFEFHSHEIGFWERIKDAFSALKRGIFGYYDTPPMEVHFLSAWQVKKLAQYLQEDIEKLEKDCHKVIRIEEMNKAKYAEETLKELKNNEEV